MNPISKRRIAELSRQRKLVARLYEDFVGFDSDELHVFGDEEKAALRGVLRTVVESEFAFRKIGRLRTQSAQDWESEFLCSSLEAYFADYCELKKVFRYGLTLKLVDRPSKLPKVELMFKQHRKLFGELQNRAATAEERTMILLRLIRIEWTWFGHNW